MDINFLQSLDFLIQKANKEKAKKNWNIIFKLEKELFTADFIDKTNHEKATFKSVYSDNENVEIPLLSKKSFDKFRTGKNYADSESPLKRAIHYLNNENSFEIYRLLKLYIDEFSVDSSQLDNFAFNVKNLTTGETFPFIEINESSKVQFVTLATDEDLQTLTHVSK